MAKILTTHVGSLPRTQALLDANQRRAEQTISEDEFQNLLHQAVDAVVEEQHRIGIDIINDGEYGHITSGKVDFGAWWNYSFSRLGGLTLSALDRWDDQRKIRSTPGHIELTTFQDRRDRALFRKAYEDPTAGILVGRAKVPNPEFTGPVTYIGHDETKRDVENLLAALHKRKIETGFLAALSPGSAARLTDHYYHDQDQLLNAVADAMHEEYKIITDAGLTVQLDAPDLAEAWDQINPEPSVEDFLAWLQKRVDAANRALAGIPTELIRLHICWGSWHGPHTTDIPFETIVDTVLKIRAKSYSFEAASPRHAHEWRVWETRKDEARVLVPGVVSHATNAVEHPQLVADRLQNYIRLVGPDHVIASTDCGLGGRLHASIAWAKLESLVAGARLASSHVAGAHFSGAGQSK